MSEPLSQSEIQSLLEALAAPAAAPNSTLRNSRPEHTQPGAGLLKEERERLAEATAARLSTAWSHRLGYRVELVPLGPAREIPATLQSSMHEEQPVPAFAEGMDWPIDSADFLAELFLGGQSLAHVTSQRSPTDWDRTLQNWVSEISFEALRTTHPRPNSPPHGTWSEPHAPPNHHSSPAHTERATLEVRVSVQAPSHRLNCNVRLSRLLATQILQSWAVRSVDNPELPHQNDSLEPQGRAIMACIQLSDDDLNAIALGDVLVSDQDIDAPIEYHSGDRSYRGHLGAQDGHKAIRIIADRTGEDGNSTRDRSTDKPTS